MSTSSVKPSISLSAYPKRIKRTLELEAEILTLDQENYFTSTHLDDDLIGDLARGLFPDAGISLISINGVRLKP